MNLHNRPFELLALLVGVLTCRTVWAQHDAAITPELYRVVCDVAVEALPRPLQAFYRNRRDALHRIASSMDPVAKQGGAGQSSLAQYGVATGHYIWLDAEVPPDGDSEARLAAAAAFRHASTHPSANSEQRRNKRNGTLPWALEGTFHTLVDAFRAEDGAALISTTGVLIHLAVDAATPAQVTAWGRGERHRQAQARFAEKAAAHTYRLVHEVRVSPLRFRIAPDALEEVFEVLIATHRTAVIDFAPLLTHEDGGDHSHRTGDARQASHSAGDDDVWAELLERRLEAGALLAARLIGTAWTQADLPQLPTSTERTAAAIAKNQAQATKTGAKPEAKPLGPILGASSSKVFHRKGCSHTRRISPANVVTFSTPDEAIRAGRKPCRTCKPRAAPPPPP